MGKETFYFSHDYNTRNDSKIKKLLSVHGYIGYGFFWALIEDLYNNANALPTHYDSIAFDLRTTKDIIMSIINDFGLFIIDEKNEIFYSNSIKNRLENRNNKSIKARESAFKRWNNANALPTQCDSNAIKESKVKESKVKDKSSKKTKTVFSPPSLSEVIEYFKENNFPEILAKKAFNYYETGLWHDSKGVQVRNWKQKMQSVWFKEENRLINIVQTPEPIGKRYREL